MINILIVDDQKSVRARLEYLVRSIADFKVVGIADNGLDAIAMAQELQPSIVLLDMEMPQLDGLMATRLIAEECPQTKILVLSSHDKQEYVAKSMSVGATGYLLKGSSDEEIEQAIRFVHKGYTHIGAGLFEKMLPVVQHSAEIEPKPAKTQIDDLAPTSATSLTIPAAKSTITQATQAVQVTSEISPPSKANGNKQVIAWLLVGLGLTTGIYTMRQWLRKPLPTLTHVEQSEIVTETKFTGKLQSAKTFKIAAIDPGIIDKIHVQIGEKIEVGQTLLTIKNIAAEDRQKQIVQEQQLTRQQQQTVLQQQQTAQQKMVELEQQINRLKYSLAPLRAKVAEANRQVSIAQSQANKLPFNQSQDSVLRTKAVYERALAKFNRLNQLQQQGGISQEQLEQAQADLKVAKIDYDTAIAADNASTKVEQSQQQLSQLQATLAVQEQQDAIAGLEKQKQNAGLEYQQATEKLALLQQQATQLSQYQGEQINRVITATEAGIVAELPVTVGEQIYGGNPVIGLAKLEQLKIQVPVNARLVNGLKSQQEALIHIGEGVTAQKFEGKIATVNPLPTENLDYLVEVEFANPQNSLMIGQLAQVQFLPQKLELAGGN